MKSNDIKSFKFREVTSRKNGRPFIEGVIEFKSIKTHAQAKRIIGANFLKRTTIMGFILFDETDTVKNLSPITFREVVQNTLLYIKSLFN